MRGSLFPLFPLFWWSMSWQDEKTWRTKIGEIGTLSWFWHFTQGKRWEGPYFPLPLRAKCQNHERVPISPISPILVVHVSSDVKTLTMKIGEIGEIGTLSWFWHFTLGEIGTLSAFSLAKVPKPWEGPYFPYFGGPCLDKKKRHGPPK